MRSLLFLLFIIGSVPVFGQSAKKMNKQLQSDLLLEQQKQDSSYRIFVQERRVLEEIRKRLEDQLKTKFYSEDQELRRKEKVIRRYLDALELLDISTKDVFPNGFHPDTLLDYKTFVKHYDNPLNRFVTFHFVSKDLHITDEDKLGEKNEILQEMIRKYQAGAKKNRAKFQDLKDFTSELTELEPRLDSLLQVYRSRDHELQQKEELLSNKYLEARENYRLKGPKGFPVAYSEYFWDVHPLPGEEWVTTSTMEYDPEVRNDVVAAPMIHLVVDEPPRYPDGMAAMRTYMEENLIYPPSAKENGISGKLYLRFVVSETGEISDVTIMRGIEDCPECDDEAIRLVKSMPRWIPGREKGFEVRSYFSLPVSF